MMGVEAHIGHNNVDIIDLTWGPERASGHLIDRGCPERHAWSGTPLQINPKQVDAGRVGLGAAGKRPRIKNKLERVLAARIHHVACDGQGRRRLDASEDIVILDAGPCVGKLLDVRQLELPLSPGRSSISIPTEPSTAGLTTGGAASAFALAFFGACHAHASKVGR